MAAHKKGKKKGCSFGKRKNGKCPPRSSKKR